MAKHIRTSLKLVEPISIHPSRYTKKLKNYIFPNIVTYFPLALFAFVENLTCLLFFIVLITDNDSKEELRLFDLYKNTHKRLFDQTKLYIFVEASVLCSYEEMR